MLEDNEAVSSMWNMLCWRVVSLSRLERERLPLSLGTFRGEKWKIQYLRFSSVGKSEVPPIFVDHNSRDTTDR